jgi:hypothetical protein
VYKFYPDSYLVEKDLCLEVYKAALPQNELYFEKIGGQMIANGTTIAPGSRLTNFKSYGQLQPGTIHF